MDFDSSGTTNVSISAFCMARLILSSCGCSTTTIDTAPPVIVDCAPARPPRETCRGRKCRYAAAQGVPAARTSFPGCDAPGPLRCALRANENREPSRGRDQVSQFARFGNHKILLDEGQWPI